MCVIVYKPKKANITKRTLKQCWNANSDSAGFMFSTNNNLIIYKGFTAFKSFYKDYRKQEKQYNENFVLHFRIATHGRIDKRNCHPFVVNKNIGFAHNGILDCVEAVEDKSDTAMFCENVLQKLPGDFLERKEYRIMLESVCTAETSKFVFLTNKGIAHIFNESSGTWRQGCWFSNLHFLPFDNTFPKRKDYSRENIGTNWMDQSDDYVECIWCGDYYQKSEGMVCCKLCAEELERDKFPIDRDYIW